jgi:ribosomal protein S17E
MGKIKSKPIKKNAEMLLDKDIKFTSDFEKNKEILGDTLPNKKMRNQMAGYLARLKKIKNKQGG